MTTPIPWREELQAATELAQSAGQAILRIREEGFDTLSKGDAGPITTADTEADRILRQGLLGRFPEDGWLSEESADDPGRLARRRCWIVDPLDGTKEFLQGIEEFCVSVALAEGESVVLGVIYNPSTDELYWAYAGQGAWLNGHRIRADKAVGDKPLLAASRSEVGKGKWQPLADRADVRPAGSAAFKLALVAAGEVDGTFTMAPRNEWDLAAGALLVSEAGGVVSDRGGNRLRFNQPDPLKDGVLAASAEAAEAVEAILRASMA